MKAFISEDKVRRIVRALASIPGSFDSWVQSLCPGAKPATDMREIQFYLTDYGFPGVWRLPDDSGWAPMVRILTWAAPDGWNFYEVDIPSELLLSSGTKALLSGSLMLAGDNHKVPRTREMKRLSIPPEGD